MGMLFRLYKINESTIDFGLRIVDYGLLIIDYGLLITDLKTNKLFPKSQIHNPKYFSSGPVNIPRITFDQSFKFHLQKL
jgi:hypothetical protein